MTFLFTIEMPQGLFFFLKRNRGREKEARSLKIYHKCAHGLTDLFVVKIV